MIHTHARLRGPELVVRLHLIDGLDQGELDAVLQRLAARWAADDRIAVRFQYEWHDDDGQWWRSYGNELWHFDADGYMSRREASINDVAITEAERRVRPGRGELPPS